MASRVDGWASDYLRQLNTQGPGNPGNIVSSKVQYVSPVVQTEARTNDTPMYTEDDARGAYVAPASGYRAPAGGGWDVNSSDTNLRFPNESGGRRYARPKRTQSRSRGHAPANGVKTRSAPLSGSDVTAAVVKAVKADGNTSFANWRQSLVNQGWDGDPSKIKYDPSTGKFVDIGGGQAAPAKTEGGAQPAPAKTEGGAQPAPAKTESGAQPAPAAARYITDGVETAAPVPGRTFITTENTGDNHVPDFGAQPAASRRTAPESSSIEGQFKNMPWYEDAKAHHEAVKKNMDNYGSALGTLKSTWDDIPWWTKLVMLPTVFKAGSPAAGASTTGNVWAEGGRAAAGDATAGAKAFEEALSRMNGGAVRGAPVEGTGRAAEAAAEAAAEGRRLYGPVAERLLAPKGPLTGGARTTLTSADEGLPVGYSLLHESPKGTSAWRGAAADYGVSPAGGSVKLDLNGVPGAAGREAATAGGQAAGREAATASEAAAGREAATSGEAAADGGVSELANAGNAGRVERVPSLDISMAPSETVYSAVDRFMMEHSGGASAVQDAIELVTGKAPELERVADVLRALPRNQLEQVFMNLREIGAAI